MKDAPVDYETKARGTLPSTLDPTDTDSIKVGKALVWALLTIAAQVERVAKALEKKR